TCRRVRLHADSAPLLAHSARDEGWVEGLRNARTSATVAGRACSLPKRPSGPDPFRENAALAEGRLRDPSGRCRTIPPFPKNGTPAARPVRKATGLAWRQPGYRR